VPEADPRTEAGELGAALNRMLARIEGAFAERTASEERLRRFVADASHELRTPITTIRGYAELHRQGGLEDPEARWAAMERTEQEALRMGALVDDLLLLARLDQGRPLDRAPVDLGAVAADTVADTTVAHPGHVVVLDRAPGPLVVAGDDHRLRQVVANLVGNATDHTPDGTTVTVRLAAEPGPPDAPGAVRLEVADDGPGMAPEVAARAFERFARGDASRSRRSGGSGLGLSIVAAIVEAHGGTVALRSHPGHGTTVAVRLPPA
jgi:two-component system OmpR family sensor kinase